jgi:hypothetical protein
VLHACPSQPHSLDHSNYLWRRVKLRISTYQLTVLHISRVQETRLRGWNFNACNEQEVLGRTNRIFSPHYKLSIWHDRDRIESTASSISSIVAYLFVAAGTYLLSRCLVTLWGHTQTARRCDKPFIFLSKESKIKMDYRYNIDEYHGTMGTFPQTSSWTVLSIMASCSPHLNSNSFFTNQ